jgi:5-(carboxyamino)imidazole ribonucleotide mutase
MKVAVIMGSDSDWNETRGACETLKKFKVEFEAHVISAHRSPEDLLNYIKHAEEEGVELFICAAGKAAHLAGTVAAHTVLPVIAIPIETPLGGLDSLLSSVQMPPGVPVAVVAIGGSVNAALLAIQMLSMYDSGMKEQLIEYRKEQVSKVREKDKRIQEFLQTQV